MYLKALEIQGFKSFPDRTRLTFDKDITAIVGPNGSGKSNISDAVMWVMGEQRTKTLRGGKMEDVIFGGTEKRGPLGFAQVTLILDNSRQIFNIENSEVMITRRYYRSGDSEYYLNRESVRLKDITDLLLDTGLGRDGYSIIGQGRIDEIVSAKSADRRDIFEEAAGISRYRHRKEESQRKLERTEENLLRINDKIDELEMQVGPLREQAEKAKKYLVLRDELRALEVSVWMESLDRIRAQAQTVAEEYEQAKNNLDLSHRELDELYAKAERITDKMRERDIEADSTRRLLSQTEAAAAECESAAAVLRTNLNHNFESIDRMKSELSEQENRARDLGASIVERTDRIKEIDGQRALLDAEIRNVSKRTEENAAGDGKARARLSALVERESALNEKLTRASTELDMLSVTVQELMDRETGLAGETAAAQEKLAEASNRARDDKKALTEAKEKAAECENIITGYNMRLSGRENRVRELTDKKTRLTIDMNSCASRVNMLTEMEKDFEGFSKAVKSVMQQAQRGALRGVHAPVANLIKTGDKFALAIETALGASAQNVVVDLPENGKAGIEFLKNREIGRATFLPISSTKPLALRRVPSGEDGFVGLASGLVEADGQYRDVIEYLLGRTVIAETLSDALRMAKKYDNSFRIVTLDGQVMNVGGSMTGGSSAKGTGVLSRANELARLKAQGEKLSAELEKCQTAFSEAEREYNAVKYELEVARTEQTTAQETLHRAEAAVTQSELLLSTLEDGIQALQNEKLQNRGRIKDAQNRIEATRGLITATDKQLDEVQSESEKLAKGREELEALREKLSAELSALKAQSASLSAEREATQASLRQLTQLQTGFASDTEKSAAAMAELEQKSVGLREELALRESRLAEFSARIGELKQSVSDITNSKLELEGRRTQTEKAGQDKNRELLDLERQCAKIEQKKLSSEMEEKQLIDKLWDSYELSYTAAQAQRQPVESVAKATKRLGELRRGISALGNPNLGAIEEYDRVSTRYDFLSGQRDDVEKAKKELEKIIADITKQMKEIFVREFKAIDTCFRQTFLELFGGGKAALALEDEENVLDCGIEIKVQPPGKALSSISLLSGGEKAFVAIALYFAIMKVRPTPFCIMDEIEAALDESNVGRFADYMRLMAKNTQFLVITHRRGTMEEADILYGVTMQEKGVTKVMSVDLDEAERTITA